MMSLPSRKKMRLLGFDYSSVGAYFVTICSHDRENLFGSVDNNGICLLNHVGFMVESMWRKIPERFPNVKIDQFVVMPNHLHGIINIIVGAGSPRPNIASPCPNYETSRPNDLDNGAPQNTDNQNNPNDSGRGGPRPYGGDGGTNCGVFQIWHNQKN